MNEIDTLYFILGAVPAIAALALWFVIRRYRDSVRP